jgi:hypothetical protein
MHTHFVFFLAAFGAALPDDAPTFDPDESESALLDEYMADTLQGARKLQFFSGNNTNTTPTDNPATPAVDESLETTEDKLPLLPLAAVGIGGAAVAAFFLMRPAYQYETHDYDHAAESGLLDHPDYDVHYDDGSDEYKE